MLELLRDTNYGMREVFLRDCNGFWSTFGRDLSPAPDYLRASRRTIHECQRNWYKIPSVMIGRRITKSESSASDQPPSACASRSRISWPSRVGSTRSTSSVAMRARISTGPAAWCSTSRTAGVSR
jgi:hypothetical protein